MLYLNKLIELNHIQQTTKNPRHEALRKIYGKSSMYYARKRRS